MSINNLGLIEGEISSESYVSRFITSFKVLDFLELYKTDKASFLNVYMDLVIRGYYLDLVNFEFKKIIGDKGPKIVVENEDFKFSKINFNDFGLPFFVYRFDVEDDLFFDGVYLNSFKLFNPDIDLTLFHSKLVDAGFLIIDSNDYKSNKQDSSPIVKVESLEDPFKEKVKPDKNGIKIEQTFESLDEKYRVYQTTFGPITFYRDYKANIKDKISNSLFNINEEFYNSILIYLLKNNHEVEKDMLAALLSQSTLSMDLYKENIAVMYGNPRYIIDIPKEFDEPFFGEIDEETISLFENNKIFQSLSENIKDIDSNDLTAEFFFKLKNKIIKVNKEEDELDVFVNLMILLKENINERNREILYERHIERKTLQEIAYSANPKVTRERIRQIQRNTEKSIVNFYRSSELIKALKTFLITKPFVILNDFSSILSDENIMLLRIFIDGHDSTFNYNEQYDLCSLKNIDFVDEMKKHIDVESNFILIKDIETQLNNFNKKYHLSIDLDYFLEKTFNNDIYRKGKGIYYRRGANLYDRYEYIITNFIGENYHRFDDYDQLVHHLYSFGFSTDKINDRNVFATLERHPDVLLTKPTYFSFEKFIDEELLNSQKKFAVDICESEIKKSGVFDLHNFDKSKVPDSLAFKSELHIYSILRKYYFDNYTFGQGNLLTIRPKDDEAFSRGEELKNYLLENGMIAKKSDVAKALNWPMYTINQAIASNNYLSTWSEGYVLYINQDDIEKYQNRLVQLKNSINLIMIDSDSINREDLYRMIEPQYSHLFKVFNINKGIELQSFIANVYDDFSESGLFIVKSNSDMKVRDILTQQLPEFFTEEEFFKIMKDNSYADTTVSQYFTTNYRNEVFYQIDDDLYCIKHKFVLDEIFEKNVVDYFNKIVESNLYVIVEDHMTHLEKFDADLGYDFDLNNHLVASILAKNGYHSLLHHSEEIHLYVKKDEIASFEDLVLKTASTEDLSDEIVLGKHISNLLLEHSYEIDINRLINLFKE